MSAPPIDLTGQQRGKLLILSRVSGKEGVRFLCRCECGREKIFTGVRIRQENILSCNEGACKNRRRPRPRNLELSLKRRCVGAYKNNARTRSILWDLTEEQAFCLFDQECYYCGSPPSNCCKDQYSPEQGFLLYSGIDRVDNSVGYIASNCVACCSNCNTAKKNMSQADFLKLANRIASRHPWPCSSR